MKFFKNIIIIVSIALVSLQSCDTELDLLPSDQVEEDLAFKDFDAAQTALYGTYKTFTITRYNHYFLNHIFFIPDVMGDDVYMSESGNYGRYVTEYQYSAIPSQMVALETWATPYSVIDNANRIINGLDQLEEGDRKNQILGQARAIRAYTYHFLIRLYAQAYGENPDAPGLVLRDKSSLEPVERSTIKDTYDLIVSDLEFAATNLKPNKDKSFIDQKAAQALLARVYLDMGETYADKTVEFANKAVEGMELMSTDEYATEEFSSINSETLWAYTSVTGNSPSFLSVASFYYYANGAKIDEDDEDELDYIDLLDGYSSLRVSKTFIKMFDDADARKKTFPVIEGKNEILTYLDGALTSKHRHKNMQMGIGSVNMIRAAEMHLIIAEIEADRGADEKARTALNILREARGLAKYTEGGQKLIDEIQLERRRELYGEGHRIFDIKRRKESLNRVGVEGQWAKNSEVIPAASPLFSFPIPQREFDSNTALTEGKDQNPGY